MTFEGACIIASLNLIAPMINDISALDCELYKLNEFEKFDSAPWNDLATACIGPESLFDSTNCQRLPVTNVMNEPAFPLYSEDKANDFFDSQTKITSCDGWFSGPPPQGQCSCSDVSALKTLGSERRRKMLEVHESRVASANQIRKNRKIAIDVITKLLLSLKSKDQAQFASIREMYSNVLSDNIEEAKPLTKV